MFGAHALPDVQTQDKMNNIAQLPLGVTVRGEHCFLMEAVAVVGLHKSTVPAGAGRIKLAHLRNCTLDALPEPNVFTHCANGKGTAVCKCACL